MRMKNPFMSLWLSAANSVIGKARGQATTAARRSAAGIQTQMTKQIVDFWTGAALKKKPATRRRKTPTR
ncbi:hypothetical protein [Derxia lacustris]|uniref:hypothetical protein n=1 Tax=Derxia lacustris TaxID=764842 RepID=UPI000A175495|nr:hypothetical protein [Derxia lacustris]